MGTEKRKRGEMRVVKAEGREEIKRDKENGCERQT